jgi:adenosylmethionine-8-amino-7-oxononanoate aminotransferase
VAVKMSFHYWRNVGQAAKRRFITLANSYHGETLGALAVGNVELYKEIYRPLLMEVITVPSPDCYARAAGASWAEHSRAQFAHMEAALEQHAHETAAVIIEPLVQCAGGMRMYDPVYLSLLRAACDRHGVHLIADEIAVGFGRTGTLFACEQAGIRPDFMCLSKGLTGGYLPLSTVLTTEPIYAAFYDEYVNLNAFLHSHSFTGNPLACAAARASLAIFREDQTLERNQQLAAHMGARARELADHPHVAEVRQRGMIVAIEMVRDKASRTPYAWQERRGLTIYRHALGRGVLLRPVGNVVYFMPPYVITPDEIDLMMQVAREGIETATCD